MLKTKTVSIVTTRTDYQVDIDRERLIELLKREGVEIPKGADIYVQVPGGGDWSNMSLEIDKETPVVVKWTVVSEDVNEG
jgi:hypothetical protein